MSTGRIEKLPVGCRQLMPGEVVRNGDYLQIHNTFYLVDGSAWVDDQITIRDRVWRHEPASVSPLDSEYGMADAEGGKI